jgi:hypothetical protein
LTFQIGEGAFGEVFLLSTHSAPVLKIVPVDGSAPVNGQPQTKLSDMLAEIIITTELSHLRQREKHVDDFAANFVEVFIFHLSPVFKFIVQSCTVYLKF